MVNFECTNCGGRVLAQEGQSMGVCDSCGCSVTIPKAVDDQTLAHFNRGNDFRRKGDFDKALAVYEQIVAEDDTNAEAHWCCALCRFGIEYVEDKVTFEYLPTCHRASLDSFLEDVDYQAALKHADVVAKRKYQQAAAKIAEVQRGILATSQTEEPFDVFICYKETDHTGHRTQDSFNAQKIYYELTEQEGYRVFFSRITLEDKGGTQYEPYIFAALNSAKVMLVIGSSKEYLESVWVKNEWSRYLQIIKKDRKKLLVPCYAGGRPEDILPDAISGFQSYNINEIGFIQDLTRRLRKVLKTEPEQPTVVVQAPQPVVQQVVQGGGSGPNADALLKRGNMALEDKDWNKAQEFYDQVLNMNAECAEAYLGKAFIDFRVTDLSKLEDLLQAGKDTPNPTKRQAGRPNVNEEQRLESEYVVTGYYENVRIRDALRYDFSYNSRVGGWEKLQAEAENKLKSNRNFTRAVNYAEPGLKKRLELAREGIRNSYSAQISKSRDADDAQAKQLVEGYATHLKKAEEKIRQGHAQALKTRDSDYDLAVTRFNRIQGNATISDLTNVRNLFAKRGIAGYRDSESYIRKCDEQIREIKKENDRREEARRRHEAEMKKKAEAKARAQKMLITVAVIAALVALVVFVIYPNLVVPNQENPDRYTPELLKTFSGTYATGNVKGTAIITLTECNEDGKLKGTFEFMVDEDYGKYEITGAITSKKNKGDVKLTITAGAWILQPGSYTPLEEMEVNITDDYQTFTCNRYKMQWSVGGKSENAIETAEDLSKLNNATGTFMLSGDVDLSGVSFKPIEGFTGTLLGNGFAIKNMTIESSDSNVGFFSALEGNVMNLKFENASVTVSGRNENVGILCGIVKAGSITGIEVSGTVRAEMSTNVAGIIGQVANTEEYAMTNMRNSASVHGLNNVGGVAGLIDDYCERSTTLTVTLQDFHNTAEILGDGEYCGGVVGNMALNNGYGALRLNASTMSNVGSVKGTTYVGGLIGAASSDDKTSVMVDLSNEATVEGESVVGGIAGKLSNIVLDNCTNENTTLTANGHTLIDGKKYAFVGGYVGYGYLVNNCTNTVEINYTGTGAYVGGIIGYTDAVEDYSMTGLKNTAAITGYELVGGIIGGLDNYCERSTTLTVQLSNFENTAAIIGTGDYIGGLIGYLKVNNGYGSLELIGTELNNSGDVKGNNWVGGVLGYAYSDTRSSYIQDCSNASAIEGQSYVGCLAGELVVITVTDCTNNGSSLNANGAVSEDGKKYAYVGGFVGKGFLANNCTNTVAIDYSGKGRYVGGIMGYTNANEEYTMSGLSNTAPVRGFEYVGGIIGGMENYCERSTTLTVTLSDMENSADVAGVQGYVGGIIGYLHQNNGYGSLVLYISDSHNTGTINGKSYVGGILGYGKSDSDKSTITDCTSSGKLYGSLDGINVQ